MSTVLYVEDDVETAHVHGQILEEAGHRVLTARDGKEALERFASERPSVVVTDIVMEDYGGAEFVVHLRSVKAGVPIIVITGAVDVRKTAFQRLCSAMRVQAVLTKPFDPSELSGMIEEYAK
jgi:CheY-like chemotaxis protein